MIKMYRKIGGHIGSALLSMASGVGQDKNEIFKHLTAPFPMVNCVVNESFVDPVSININLSVPTTTISSIGGLV
jgi:hypothetical protein